MPVLKQGFLQRSFAALLSLGYLLSPAHAVDYDENGQPIPETAASTEWRPGDPKPEITTNEPAPEPGAPLAEAAKLNAVVNFAGHFLPVIPLSRSLRDRNKRFYMFVETPSMGLVTDPFAAAVASYLTGNPYFSWDTAQTMAEGYFSYQLTQITRNGVTLDEKLSNNTKVLLNWWITSLIYGTVTGGPLIYKALQTGSPTMWSFAVATVSFAMGWSAITQNIQTRLVVPYFFARYPDKTLLEKIAEPNYSIYDLVEPRQAEIEAIVAKAAASGKKMPRKDALKIKSLEAQIKWIYWFRGDVRDGSNSVPKAKARWYWVKKFRNVFVVACTFITAYQIARWELVGRNAQPEAWGPMTKLVHVIADKLGPEDGVSATPQEVEGLTRAVVEQIKESGPAPGFDHPFQVKHPGEVLTDLARGKKPTEIGDGAKVPVAALEKTRNCLSDIQVK